MYTPVLSDLNSMLISLLDLDTRQNMHNQNETVLVHYKEGISASVPKNNFYNKKKFRLLLILHITSGAMVSRDIVSSIKHPTMLFDLDILIFYVKFFNVSHFKFRNK